MMILSFQMFFYLSLCRKKMPIVDFMLQYLAYSLLSAYSDGDMPKCFLNTVEKCDWLLNPTE